MGLKTGQAGIDLIKRYEGCRLDAYKCLAGVWTIGYGHTGDVKSGQKITQAQAEAILIADLEKFEKKVNNFYSRYRWTQHEFDALVSFAFNLGSIDQLTAGGTRSREVIAEKMLLYNKAAGKGLSGLTRRRQEERALFLSANVSGDNETAAVLSKAHPILKKGSEGSSVKELQQILKAKGYEVGAIDGIFGYKTLAAVKVFQKANGLTVDAIVGAKTWEKLSS
ncbi:MAG: glycoside hydrolase family protein [Lachnospiraceae bacterium]|nr:glycoside hydrolase family protein [Lachnospiraceae bacterium]